MITYDDGVPFGAVAEPMEVEEFGEKTAAHGPESSVQSQIPLALDPQPSALSYFNYCRGENGRGETSRAQMEGRITSIRVQPFPRACPDRILRRMISVLLLAGVCAALAQTQEQVIVGTAQPSLWNPDDGACPTGHCVFIGFTNETWGSGCAVTETALRITFQLTNAIGQSIIIQCATNEGATIDWYAVASYVQDTNVNRVLLPYVGIPHCLYRLEITTPPHMVIEVRP